MRLFWIRYPVSKDMWTKAPSTSGIGKVFSYATPVAPWSKELTKIIPGKAVQGLERQMNYYTKECGFIFFYEMNLYVILSHISARSRTFQCMP